MTRFTCHFFLCTNRRDPDNPKGCCASKGSEDIASELKRQAHAAGLKGKVRVNKAGCLDACEDGVSAVVYPQGVWYSHITLDDVDEIVQRTLIGGEIIERLRAPSGHAS
ncbi:MAG: (2Fe-2S) ferredoxin domain-containing protein [Planctomycetota bacterium]